MLVGINTAMCIELIWNININVCIDAMANDWFPYPTRWITVAWSKKYGPSTKASEKQHVATRLNDIERILK